jgi:cobalt-precorrin-5B (C1)-methyltransferase
MPTEKGSRLKRGWTTGACATAATRAAYTALLTGTFPDPVSIVLPKGERPAFPLAVEGRDGGSAMAGIVKDAGDDPDVTHGATIISKVSPGAEGSGVVFVAGEGVGTVTLAGLPVAVGEPAINPVPRRMMRDQIVAIAAANGAAGDVVIEISVPGGEALAAKTWNPRLGIVGGLSILGTTGVVHPFSCSAWVHSIHRGIDVARAAGIAHIAGSTGSTSEDAVKTLYSLPDIALIDMGDFAGGLLKYLRRHPVPCVTIAGGFAKLTKLAQGFLDLHSGRSQVDFAWLADRLTALGAAPDVVAKAGSANTANEVLETARQHEIDLASPVAAAAASTARNTVGRDDVAIDVVIVARDGRIVGRSDA